jgi:hypothetical protein
MIIVADARDPLAQSVVFLLQTVILGVEPVFFVAKAPQMKCATLADDGDQRQQEDEGAE